MNFDLNDRTVFLTLAGSHSYGFATKQSDFDYRGIAVPQLSSYIGVESKIEQIVDTQHKHIWKHYPAGLVQPNADMQVMEISKFVRLAMQCNPSIIEILFSPEDCIIRSNPILKSLLDIRQHFLTKQVKARFASYALQQLEKIKRHKRFLDNPPQKAPDRKDFGLPDYKEISADQLGAGEAIIRAQVDEFSIDQDELPEHIKIDLNFQMKRILRFAWGVLHTDQEFPVGRRKEYDSLEDVLFEAMAKRQQFSENLIEILKEERLFKQAQKEWNSYQTWLKERNPQRAEIEKKFGFDRKHAVHLVRLLRMAREILEQQQVLVRRPDAEELLAIRNGAWTYEQICEFAQRETLAVEELVKTSTLPRVCPVAKIHEVVFDIILKFNMNKCGEYDQDKLSEIVYSLLIEPSVKIDEELI